MAKGRRYSARGRKSKEKTVKAPIWLVALIVLIGLLFWAADYYKILPYADVTARLGLSDAAVNTDSEFTVHYIDVGQGDSELIVSGNCTVLIDGGEVDKGAKVLEYLRKQGIKKLDYIVGTHPHSDHIGGLPDVIKAVQVENIILPNIPKAIVPTTQSYRNLLNAVKVKGLTVTPAAVGDIYDLGGIATMKIVAPISEISENLNDYSIVLRADYKQTSFLFVGDAEKQEEADVLSGGENIDVDVLKAGHHGSGTSSGKDFLDAVTPRYAVVESGAENPYGHPHKSAMKRLMAWTDDIYQTAVNGSVVCFSDGNKLDFICERDDNS